MMNKNDLFQFVRDHILSSPGFQDVPFFPNNVQPLSHIEQLIWWLAITDFSSSQDGLKSALAELVQLLYLLDPSNENVFKVLWWMANQDTTELLAVAAQGVALWLKYNDRGKAQEMTQHMVQFLVNRQPGLRAYLAGWIIYEFHLGYHPDLPLVAFAEKVKHTYESEFDRPVDVDMPMTIGLATRSLSERDRLNTVVGMALNHLFPNISSLAIIWLAEAHMEEPFLKRTLENIQHLTLKQLWNRAQYHTFLSDPSHVLLAGNTFQDSFGPPDGLFLPRER